MEMLQVVVWLVYPYAVIAILGIGFIWKANAPVQQEEQGLKFLNGTTIGLLILSFTTGLAVILFYGMANEPVKLFGWVKSLVYLEPDMDLIRSISFLSRTHLLILLTFLLMLPFSTYIRYLWPARYFSKDRWSRNIGQ